ncbi:hypothetical protein A6A08_06995 [Nocardiopsis sp. TSRI0078]|uniref:hypothetical protein n=1 Tax=unclassified Nocardiopsis TaxID=2649073 RepID=UPI00093D8DDC|nr:hypothetical protein [Nocardiopsis sp. TSRI0078]OKI17007.1 hypothetical protein A6A08_06995 [Nocardiopsis sp. TSRI0078]
MTHPIPAPRPSSDPLYRPLPPLPRRRPLVGPFCPACEHPSCRQRRAARLPRLGGQRSEYQREHARAATLQRHNPHLLIWWGESTLSYWVASPAGLTEAREPGELLLLLDPAPVLVC